MVENLPLAEGALCQGIFTAVALMGQLEEVNRIMDGAQVIFVDISPTQHKIQTDEAPELPIHPDTAGDH